MSADSIASDRLPFVLHRENVARYENGVVVIGDRRKYPFEKVFVRCEDVESVARAIEDMVTQGGGQWVAAVYGLALAARQTHGTSVQVAIEHLEMAAERLIKTRPTNTSIARMVRKALAVIKDALESGAPLEAAILEWIERTRDEYYTRVSKMGRYGAALIADGDGILTNCFAESSFLLALSFAERDGKQIRVFTPETRPYLQGARLTAPSVHEMGIPVQLITDNMPAFLMSQGKVQKYFTASDLVTMDGHVVNKVGTFQNALAANYHRVPYFAFSLGPDPKKPDRASIVIEERDPAEVKNIRGVPTTIDEIDAYYPAFDITPPHLVSGVITEFGILNPYDLKHCYS